jgi:hypothetical protein
MKVKINKKYFQKDIGKIIKEMAKVDILKKTETFINQMIF